ncbi:MAG: SMP-30/gluconolactonase/LRE family protein [Candidatus Aminicenantes bacterium]|nr:SMP-30/gluconolactonase/LRE family protein [Candidatus Aminicenantes bacterium]
MKKILLIVLGAAIWLGSASAQEEFIPFDAGHWNLGNARVVEQAGRQAVAGLAVLKEVEFEDGVIEFDVWAPDIRLTGGRAYPGVIFRMQTPQQAERLYIRPHRAGLYADAIQYTPVFNGVAGWQLYSGAGFTNTLQFPFNDWVPVRLEVAGSRARVFVGKSGAPALVVNDLKHGLSKGAIALYGEGAAFFSNFRYELGKTPEFPSPPPVDAVPGVIADWELSRGFPALLLDTEEYPDPKMLAEAKWRKVSAEPSGLVDIARFAAFNGAEPESVLARTVVRSDGRKQALKIDFGYSDALSIFLNGALVFAADSSYRLRDSSFLGIVGYFDSVALPLRKGANELLFVVTEGFGGWGFMCRDADAVFTAPGVAEAWRTPRIFRMPESAAYDPARDSVYVSIYDATTPSQGQGRQSIVRISLDGKTVEPAWVAGLNNPTGLAVHKDRLYAVERAALAEIDIPSGKIVARHALPAPVFPNDAAVDPASGHVFISDSGKNTIYRFDGAKVEPWLTGADILQPNGLLVHGGLLLVGTTGDGSLKTIDIATRTVSLLARLGTGIVDGIALDGDGNYLVSHNQGRLFRVMPSGVVTKILDTTTVQMNLADFTVIPGSSLLVAPTYTDGRVVAFTLK